LDYFNNVLTNFSGLVDIKLPRSLWRSKPALRFHQKYLNLCFEDERKSYGFGTTWGWV